MYYALRLKPCKQMTSYVIPHRQPGIQQVVGEAGGCRLGCVVLRESSWCGAVSRCPLASSVSWQQLAYSLPTPCRVCSSGG